MQGYTKDNLLLLYRRNATQDWVQVPKTTSGSNLQGYLITTQILPGEYTLAIGNNNVGISENDQNVRFGIFPTPANQYFYCQFEAEGWEQSQIQIFSIEGKLVYETILSNPEQSINVSQLSAGQYIVKASNSQQKTETSKLVISR
jgi:hypothetical protein